MSRYEIGESNLGFACSQQSQDKLEQVIHLQTKRTIYYVKTQVYIGSPTTSKSQRLFQNKLSPFMNEYVLYTTQYMIQTK